MTKAGHTAQTTKKAPNLKIQPHQVKNSAHLGLHLGPPATLVLEDGTCFNGYGFGATNNTALGEVVFNTAMSGYQEILGDPSYHGQIVVMTYPMIGNYGITSADFEANQVHLSALIVKELSSIASNFRAEQTLNSYLQAQQIPGLAGIDTRALVLHLRSQGVMRGIITTLSQDSSVLQQQALNFPSMQGADLAQHVSTREIYRWQPQAHDVEWLYLAQKGSIPHISRSPDLTAASTLKTPPVYRVVVYDYGVKRNILRCLSTLHAEVIVVPGTTSAQEVLKMEPDGILLSNGPGDPAAMDYAILTIQELLGKVPLFGICLGHQLLCLAAGAKSYKLKFGHRGANHPVYRTSTGQIEITSQNHGFSINVDSLKTLPYALEVTHINLHDQTLAGIRFKDLPAFSVQYHPEASPGPQDALYLFQDFKKLMDDFKKNKRS